MSRRPKAVICKHVKCLNPISSSERRSINNLFSSESLLNSNHSKYDYFPCNSAKTLFYDCIDEKLITLHLLLFRTRLNFNLHKYIFDFIIIFEWPNLTRKLFEFSLNIINEISLTCNKTLWIKVFDLKCFLFMGFMFSGMCKKVRFSVWC